MTLQEEGRLITEHVLKEWDYFLKEINRIMSNSPYSYTHWCGYALQTVCEEIIPQQFVWQIIHNHGMYPTVVLLGYKPMIEEMLSAEEIERLSIGTPSEEPDDSPRKH